MSAFSRHQIPPVSAPPRSGDGPSWDEFLGRNTPPSLEFVSRRYCNDLTGKRLIVTGAGGWIGSALVQAIAQSGAREIVLIDTSESALYEIEQTLLEMGSPIGHTAILASVCDSPAIADVFARHRPEIVFHAAALKHVPLMEINPFAAMESNAVGTQILAEAAERYGCRQMVMVSTDKAVDPLSLMGASKRIAELTMLAPRTGAMLRKAVRLGNVLGSSGSVVPLFLRQIARGGPVTVADPNVRRYFMTLTEAVEALLSSIAPGCPAGLLTPDPGTPIRIFDLAKYLIAGSGKLNIPIVFTTLRPGDKMEESLISPRETCGEDRRDLLRIVVSTLPDPDVLDTAMGKLRNAVMHRDLSLLLEAVLLLVPEYRPSQLLREQLPAGEAVNA